MSGTKSGGKKAAITNKIKHGSDFYVRIGRKGGQNGHTGGFASNPELAKRAGRIGGQKSRRGVGEKTIEALRRLQADMDFIEDKKFLKNITK